MFPAWSIASDGRWAGGGEIMGSGRGGRGAYGQWQIMGLWPLIMGKGSRKRLWEGVV